MKRTVFKYGPLLISIPVVTFLYMAVEMTLDAEDHKELGIENRFKYKHKSIVNKLQEKENADGLPKKGIERGKVHPVGQKNSRQDQDQLDYIVRNNRFAANVTYPPFVDYANGYGEDGKPVIINASELSPAEKARYDQGYKKNSFNQYISDMISIHRPLPHGWSQECKDMKFRSDLPEVSVIIIFHNEAWSVVLRSVHSVLSRTPSHLLKEVILVDDCSTFDHLKEPLEQYWQSTDKRVKVIRAKRRGGLTRARLIGYKVATAPMLVFFDSHIECFPGWFEPLADRIVSDPNVTVFPSIETIDMDTLGTALNHDVGSLGVFRWKDLVFWWDGVPEQEKKRRRSPAEPIRSPTMPGGLFAISRDFFERLGTYDPGLVYWGGENIELSFKAWMCYGSVELVPCSHVGHIFRRANPIKWETNVGLANVARVAKVWMDDYINYFLERNLYTVGNVGDVRGRQELRRRLRCRDFAWFVRNVKPILVPPLHVQHAGELKITEHNVCIDGFGEQSESPKLVGCHGSGGNQFWYISSDGEMFQDEKRVCERNGNMILDANCHDKWNISATQQLIHVISGRCLQGEKRGQDGWTLTLQTCDLENNLQRWQTKPRSKDYYFPPFD